MAFIRRFLCCLTLGLGASGVALAQTSPEQTVVDFFTARLNGASPGAPNGAELLGFSPYLAPELVCLLGAAQRYSERHGKALPNDKPPFVEGDLYSSHFEVPTGFQAEAPRIEGDAASVRVRFQYAGASGTDSWYDDIKLRHINKRRWQIEDIAYQGDFAFGNHGGLRATLVAVMSNPAAGSGWDPRELTACELPPKSASRNAGKKNASGKKGVARTKAKSAPKKAAPAHKK